MRPESREKTFKVGDLINCMIWGGFGVVLERTSITESGEFWWKVWNGRAVRLVGEWHMELVCG